MLEEKPLVDAVMRLEHWLSTMRTPRGYGGPVAHWWQNCLQFTGAGLDWRYEGLIFGYLNLYRKTGERVWLAKAQAAGDDLVNGQLSTGNFRNSCFEQNPYPGGTPHEAACDVALLHLASVLRELKEPTWEAYLTAAKWNVQRYYIARLWNSQSQTFRDRPAVDSFVPNKSATLVEALLMLARLTHDASLAEIYALPTLQAILAHQVQNKGLFQGGIYQYSQDGQFVEKFFPYYVARCIPALVQGYAWFDDARYLDAARAAMRFVVRYRYPDGSFPQVVYANGRVNRYPQWIAATADILRAMLLLRSHDIDAYYPDVTETWLLDGQGITGGFRTAWGFASQMTQSAPGNLPEFRDLLPVVGWNDKVFRYLTGLLPTKDAEEDAQWHRPSTPSSFQTACVYRGQRMRYRETAEVLELHHEGRVMYRWQKGTPWADVNTLEMLVK